MHTQRHTFTMLAYHYTFHRADNVLQNHKEQSMALGQEEVQSTLSALFSEYYYPPLPAGMIAEHCAQEFAPNKMALVEK